MDVSNIQYVKEEISSPKPSSDAICSEPLITTTPKISTPIHSSSTSQNCRSLCGLCGSFFKGTVCKFLPYKEEYPKL